MTTRWGAQLSAGRTIRLPGKCTMPHTRVHIGLRPSLKSFCKAFRPRCSGSKTEG